MSSRILRKFARALIRLRYDSRAECSLYMTTSHGREKETCREGKVHVLHVLTVRLTLSDISSVMIHSSPPAFPFHVLRSSSLLFIPFSSPSLFSLHCRTPTHLGRIPQRLGISIEKVPSSARMKYIFIRSSSVSFIEEIRGSAGFAGGSLSEAFRFTPPLAFPRCQRQFYLLRYFPSLLVNLYYQSSFSPSFHCKRLFVTVRTKSFT